MFYPKIYDHFLSNNEISTIMNILDSIPWIFGKTTTPEQTLDSNMFWFKKAKHPYFKNQIFRKIQNVRIKTFKILRVYVNGQTYGQDGKWHTDDAHENAYTAVIYLSEWDIYGGGYTLFKNNNDSHISIEPCQGRLILFKSNIEHRALAPFRESGNKLRQVLVYKLQAI